MILTNVFIIYIIFYLQKISFLSFEIDVVFVTLFYICTMIVVFNAGQKIANETVILNKALAELCLKLSTLSKYKA